MLDFLTKLFNWFSPPKPKARQCIPLPKLGNKEEIVYRMIKHHPGITTKELTKIMPAPSLHSIVQNLRAKGINVEVKKLEGHAHSYKIRNRKCH